MVSTVKILLILYMYILVIIIAESNSVDNLYLIDSNASNAAQNTHYQPITFRRLIRDIQSTALETRLLRKTFNQYGSVSGPIEELNGIEIGTLIIEFDRMRNTIGIYKFENRVCILKIYIRCDRQIAKIIKIDQEENGLSARQ